MSNSIILTSFTTADFASLIGAFGGALISGLTAIWIFWRQSDNEKAKIKDELEREQARKKDYLKGSLHHFIDMVQSVLKDKRDTFTKNQELAVNSRDYPFQVFPHKIEMNGILDRLLQLNPKEVRMCMLTYFNDKERAFQAFKGIYSMLDYYKVHGEKSNEMILQIKRENYQIQLEIKKRTYELRTILADFTAKIRREFDNPSNHELFDHFNTTLVNYVQGLDNPHTLEYHRNEFARRLLQVANSETAGIEGAKEIFDKAHEIVMLYFDLIQKGQEMHDVITNTDESFEEVNNKLEEILDRDYKEFLPPNEQE